MHLHIIYTVAITVHWKILKDGSLLQIKSKMGTLITWLYRPLLDNYCETFCLAQN